jgi:predicted Zn-dependent peptidase
VIEKDSAVQAYLLQIANGPSAEDGDRFAGRILCTILGDDTGSRLFWSLVDTGDAEFASLGPYEFQGTGVFMTYLACRPEDTKSCLEQVRQIYEGAHRNGVTDAELARAKSKICSDLVRHSESPARRLFSVGGNWLQRREYRTVRETVEAYQSVTCQDVADVLTKYSLLKQTTIAVGPMTKL